MSVRMLYLSCVKFRELPLSRKKISQILYKSCKCLLLQFYLMYNAIILYIESLVCIIDLENNKLNVATFESK